MMVVGRATALGSALLRRGIDVFAASVLLVFAAPIIIFSAIAVRVRSPGPFLFRQEREGLGLQPFVMLKLRTMYVDADARLESLLAADAAVREEWTRYRRLGGDPRIVGSVGRWLRTLSIDELPQLYNVLRGDMSMVGPRPLELEVARSFPWDARMHRSSLRPGITGLWQISGRSEVDIATLWEIDARYILTRSLRGDVAIILRTPAAVFSRRGAY